MATKLVIDCETGEITEVELTPEEVAQAEADAAVQAAFDAATTFASADDAERLRLVNERAQTDPAYAALADFVLKGVTR